jgi:hypothetical protein
VCSSAERLGHMRASGKCLLCLAARSPGIAASTAAQARAVAIQREAWLFNPLPKARGQLRQAAPSGQAWSVEQFAVSAIHLALLPDLPSPLALPLAHASLRRARTAGNPPGAAAPQRLLRPTLHQGQPVSLPPLLLLPLCPALSQLSPSLQH